MFTRLTTHVRAVLVGCILLLALASWVSTTYAAHAPDLYRPLYWRWYWYYDASGNLIGYEHGDECSGYFEAWGERIAYASYSYEQEQCGEWPAP